MKKVYCRRCRYNWTRVIRHQWCTFDKDNIYTGFTGEDRKKIDFNKDGDCSDFKRRWWSLFGWL